MQSTLIRWISFSSLMAVLSLAGNRFAAGQSTSPLTVTGSANSQIQMISTNAPSKTWSFFANQNKFDIKDGANAPFQIVAGAPSQALKIDDTGRILFSISVSTAPVRSLHVIDTNKPALRLQQSATTGNPAQAFDLEASEFGFSILDVTNSNTIPFTIEPGAPADSLFVDFLGNVGIGTGIPVAPVHVVKPGQASTAESLARFVVSDDAIGALEIRNGSTTDGILHPRLRGTTALQAVPLTMEGLITTDAGTNPVVAYDAARRSGGAVVTRPLVIYRNNGLAKVIIGANGDVTATSFNPVSSRTLKHDITDLESRDAANALRELVPVQFIYNDDASKHKRVGFIAEDVPDVVAAADRRSVPIMDVVALVTRVVKDQQQTIDEQQTSMEQQQKTIDQQQKTIDDLMRRLQALEALAPAGK